MPTHVDITKKILAKIKESDCSDAIKEFLRKIIIFELGRGFGQEYAKTYKREIEKVIDNFEEDEYVD